MNSELFVSHSYVRCLRQGLAFSLKNLGNILFFTWPILLVSLAAGVFLDGSFLMKYARGEDVGAVGYAALALFALALLLIQTTMVWQQHRLGENGALPQGSAWRNARSMLSLFSRNVLINVLTALVVGGVGFALWQGMLLLPDVNPADIPTLGWIGIGVGGILLFMVLLGLLSFLQLFWANFLYGNQRPFDTLSVTFRGIHHVWRTAALQFVQMLYVLVLLVLSWLPYALFVVMENLATETLARGEEVTLPGYYPFLHYTALFLGILGTAVMLALTLYPTLYNWCAIQSEEEAA